MSTTMIRMNPIGNPIIGIQATVNHTPEPISAPVAVPMITAKKQTSDKPIEAATM